MTAMFPDSGVPPQDARNSLPDPDTQNCNELWYSTSRCQPRFDPAAANAVLAELINLINAGEVTYDCQLLDQVQLAVKYLIQRGLPCGTLLSGGPLDYIGVLEPALTRYSNHLTLVVVPNVANSGPIRVNFNGQGLRPVLRNDGQPMQANDWTAGIPVAISYWNSSFYMLSMVNSQVPRPLSGTVDAWVRTDGNDITGDGTANTADKAFRTIAMAYYRVASAYLPSSIFAINIRLGIPGLYEQAVIGPYGGQINLHGDTSNYTGYRIRMSPIMTNSPFCLGVTGVKMYIEGVTFEWGSSRPHDAAGAMLIISEGARASLFNVGFDAMSAGAIGGFIQVQYTSSIALEGILNFQGAFATVSSAVSMTSLAVWFGILSRPLALQASNFTMVNGFMTLNANSTATLGSATSTYTNVGGPKHQVNGNSTLVRNGFDLPGTLPGTESTGGVAT